MMVTYLTIMIALFFAMNIGASGAAATMGPAYGSGAISKRWIALVVVAIAAFLGAVTGSAEVVKTIGAGIVPSQVLNVEVVLIILLSACFTLFIANLIGIPLSTSEVTVGSIVGVGIAFKALYVNHVGFIVMFWLLVPIAAFLIAFCLGKLIKIAEERWPQLKGKGKWKKVLAVLLIMTGFVEAFSAGMNNVANAVGPLIGAGMIEDSLGIYLGAIFLSLGAILLGGKVIETNGKKITSLSLLQGSAVSGTGGALVIIASIFGIPVPLTQATTSAIVGIGTADKGVQLWQKRIIWKIGKVWVVSPVLSLVISYCLIQVFYKQDLYFMVVLVSVLIAVFGIMSLLRSIREEEQSVHDQGGGI